MRARLGGRESLVMRARLGALQGPPNLAVRSNDSSIAACFQDLDQSLNKLYNVPSIDVDPKPIQLTTADMHRQIGTHVYIHTYIHIRVYLIALTRFDSGHASSPKRAHITRLPGGPLTDDSMALRFESPGARPSGHASRGFLP